MRRFLGRAAALLGVAGSLGHLLLAAEHTHHTPILTAGMLLLAVVCARCSLHLWRRPTDPAAWRDLLVLAAVMATVHFLAGATGGLSAAFLSVPLLQLALAALTYSVRGKPAPTDQPVPASVARLPGAPPPTGPTGRVAARPR